MVSDKAGHNITGTTIHVDAEMLLDSGSEQQDKHIRINFSAAKMMGMGL